MTDTAVEKTLAVLEALADHTRITDIARVTGLPKSTVHRLLATMVERGFATLGSEGYLTGPRVLALAGKVLRPMDTVERARPALRSLQVSTACTVHMALLFGDELVYVDKIEANKPYRMASRLGMSLPAHGTAIGKAMLALYSSRRSSARSSTAPGCRAAHPRRSLPRHVCGHSWLGCGGPGSRSTTRRTRSACGASGPRSGTTRGW